MLLTKNHPFKTEADSWLPAQKMAFFILLQVRAGMGIRVAWTEVHFQASYDQAGWYLVGLAFIKDVVYSQKTKMHTLSTFEIGLWVQVSLRPFSLQRFSSIAAHSLDLAGSMLIVGTTTNMILQARKCQLFCVLFYSVRSFPCVPS